MDHDERERVVEWEATLPFATYYEILGILEIADEAAIRQAFHEFSTSFHPDAHPDAAGEDKRRLERVFQRGAEAYRVLVHHERRAEYDLELARGHVRLGVPSIPPGATSEARSLEDLCQSAAGRLHAKRADRLISEGELASAKRELSLAIGAEEAPDAELAERLEALDLAVFARGE